MGIVYIVGLLGAADHPDGSSTKLRRARSPINDSYANSILSLTSSQTSALRSIVFCCCFHDTVSTLTAFGALSCVQTVENTMGQPYLVPKPTQFQDTETERGGAARVPVARHCLGLGQSSGSFILQSAQQFVSHLNMDSSRPQSTR